MFLSRSGLVAEFMFVAWAVAIGSLQKRQLRWQSYFQCQRMKNNWESVKNSCVWAQYYNAMHWLYCKKTAENEGGKSVCDLIFVLEEDGEIVALYPEGAVLGVPLMQYLRRGGTCRTAGIGTVVTQSLYLWQRIDKGEERPYKSWVVWGGLGSSTLYF